VVGEAAGADVALAAEDTLDTATDAELVLGFSLEAFGRGLGAALPAGALDYATEVRVHGDHFAALTPVPDTTPALGDEDGAAVVAVARARAAELGLGPVDRVLSTAPWPLTISGGLVDGFLAVLAAGASLVHVRHASGAQEHRAATEKVTRIL
jgi:uncharacterized protein (TIGR03089 family)